MALHERRSCAACQTRDVVVDTGNPFYPRVTGKSGNVIHFDGSPHLLAGGNDYLNLATHPRVRQAAKDAIDEFGVGMTGSPLMNGHMALHERLAAELAAWVGKEAAMVFTTGYLANLGAIGELGQMNPRGMIAIRDEGAHASLIDGMKLGGVRGWKFKHNDMNSLRRHLERARERTDKILIVVDGVYSTEGDITPLPDVVELAERYGAEIFLDDAHGFGVIAEGRGTAAHFGLADRVDYISATFSKSCGASGGFVAASREIIQHFEARCSPHMFVASLPPAMTAATLASLEIMRDEPQRYAHVMAVADTLRAELRNLGFTVGGETPIVPVFMIGMFGSPHDPDIQAVTHDDEGTQARLREEALRHKDTLGTFRTQRWLMKRGIYVNPFIPPGSADPLLRLSVTDAYTPGDVRKIVDAFDEVRHMIPALAGPSTLLVDAD